MERKITYSFTDAEIKEAVYKFKNNQLLDSIELLALVCGAEKWIEFKEECEADPSYQWGYGDMGIVIIKINQRSNANE